MGRYGNLLLVNGAPDLALTAKAGEVVRLWLTNAANTRVFDVRLPGVRMKLVGGGGHHAHMPVDGIEWEDEMGEHKRMMTTATMRWKLVDRATGAENHEIDWRFTVGDRVKIRLVNEMDSDHPMHHPFHIHGAGRFLVLARDGVVEPNLVWKDSVLIRTGQTVDILLDVTNPGLWMAHCHIGEHIQGGMIFSFQVAREDLR